MEEYVCTKTCCRKIGLFQWTSNPWHQQNHQKSYQRSHCWTFMLDSLIQYISVDWEITFPKRSLVN